MCTCEWVVLFIYIIIFLQLRFGMCIVYRHSVFSIFVCRLNENTRHIHARHTITHGIEEHVVGKLRIWTVVKTIQSSWIQCELFENSIFRFWTGTGTETLALKVSWTQFELSIYKLAFILMNITLHFIWIYYFHDKKILKFIVFVKVLFY